MNHSNRKSPSADYWSALRPSVLPVVVNSGEQGVILAVVPKESVLLTP